MRIDVRLFIIGMLLVISTMIVSTQFAIIDLEYDYEIVIPIVPDYGINYIGSDNSSDGIRVLRISQNDANESLKIILGNVSVNSQYIYSAAFGIVNEESFIMNITHMEIFSSTPTYLKIWLHGDRDANANNLSNDPTSVLMYDNGTIVNPKDTVAWTLAIGDNNAKTLCSNVTDNLDVLAHEDRYTIYTKRDETAGVRYSINDTNATSGISDFVWVQVELDIPYSVDIESGYTGIIYIHFETD